jgi:penicillin amidase
MARIHRDAYGVPHVRATSIEDLAHGQGEVTARDRVWQLEYQRRRATGTVAEVLGPGAVAWDRFARRTRIADTARRAHDRLSPESRRFVAAYVDGVNAGLHADAPELEQLGLEPGRWEPWTPLAVFLVQHLLFGALPGKLWSHRAREVLGDDAGLLSHEGPATSGSNAWAVGGDRTASGFPLVAGDPHRAFENPGVYMQVRLACDGIDVVGFAFPGVPGVQHFAHAGDVAWAITNAMADYQDVYAERLRRGDGGVEALGPDGWEPVEARAETIAVRDGDDVEVEVLTTRRGPVFTGGVGDERALSLRTASDVLGDLGFEALLPLLRARTVDDVDAALDHWVEPVNNAVVADRRGAVRYRLAGKVPLRPAGNRLGIVDAADATTAWTGWLDDPHRVDVPADRHLVTANERRGPESGAVGTTFAPPHRAGRLHVLLAGRTGLTAGDLAAMHGDVLLPALDVYRGLLEPLRPGPEGKPVRDLILGWDGRMEADSAGAAAFAAWRGALVRRIAAEPVFSPLAEPVVDDPVIAPWLDPTARIGAAVEGLVASGTPFGINLPALATSALDDAADHPGAWGETHAFYAAHAFDVVAGAPAAPALPVTPVGGDIDCVRCTGSLPGIDDSAWRGSVARYVWDLADPADGGWVVPLGAAGDPRSPHHADQLPLWAAVELVPVVTDWDRLTEETP